VAKLTPEFEDVLNETYELTNEVMETRGRIGLAVWVCINLHKRHHKETYHSFDKQWEVHSRRYLCEKCGRYWLDISPLINALNRTMCKVFQPAITKLLYSEDPIYALIRKTKA
jgi:hypothetical protein